jgi:hypothetical protein
MGRPAADVTRFLGQRFGKLTVKTAWRDVKGCPWVHVVCDCKKERDYRLYWLTRKKEPYRSCNCEKVAAHDKYVDGQLKRLGMHLHVAMWDQAQREGSTIRKIARAFSTESAVASAAVRGVNSFVASFLAAAKKDGWDNNVFICKNAMRNAGVNTFRFGKKPSTAADRKFQQQIIDPAIDLRVRYWELNLCTTRRVASRWQLVEWVYNTRLLTTKKKRRIRAEAAKQQWNSSARERHVPIETQLWRGIYRYMKMAGCSRPSRRIEPIR